MAQWPFLEVSHNSDRIAPRKGSENVAYSTRAFHTVTGNSINPRWRAMGRKSLSL
jgi:hypothetical protein